MSRNLADYDRLCAWEMENKGMFRAGQPMELEWRGATRLEYNGPDVPYHVVASWDGELPHLEVTYVCGEFAYAGRWS